METAITLNNMENHRLAHREDETSVTAAWKKSASRHSAAEQSNMIIMQSVSACSNYRSTMLIR